MFSIRRFYWRNISITCFNFKLSGSADLFAANSPEIRGNLVFVVFNNNSPARWRLQCFDVFYQVFNGNAMRRCTVSSEMVFNCTHWTLIIAIYTQVHERAHTNSRTFTHTSYIRLHEWTHATHAQHMHARTTKYFIEICLYFNNTLWKY